MTHNALLTLVINEHFAILSLQREYEKNITINMQSFRPVLRYLYTLTCSLLESDFYGPKKIKKSHFNECVNLKVYRFRAAVGCGLRHEKFKYFEDTQSLSKSFVNWLENDWKKKIRQNGCIFKSVLSEQSETKNRSNTIRHCTGIYEFDGLYPKKKNIFFEIRKKK